MPLLSFFFHFVFSFFKSLRVRFIIVFMLYLFLLLSSMELFTICILLFMLRLF